MSSVDRENLIHATLIVTSSWLTVANSGRVAYTCAWPHPRRITTNLEGCGQDFIKQIIRNQQRSVQGGRSNASTPSFDTHSEAPRTVHLLIGHDLLTPSTLYTSIMHCLLIGNTAIRGNSSVPMIRDWLAIIMLLYRTNGLAYQS